MEEQLKANALLMKEYETSFQQKLIESKQMEEEVWIQIYLLIIKTIFF